MCVEALSLVKMTFGQDVRGGEGGFDKVVIWNWEVGNRHPWDRRILTAAASVLGAGTAAVPELGSSTTVEGGSLVLDIFWW